MDVTILGSGTCIPLLTRHAPGYLLSCGDRRILIDCGSGVVRQLVALDCPPWDIDMVCLSHFHPDHVADFAPLLQAIKVGCRPPRTKPLVVAGPAGIGAFYRDVIGSWMRPDAVAFPQRLVELEEGYDDGALAITAAPAMHTRESLAYRFSWQGRSLVYSGDSAYCEALLRLCRGAELLIADCSSLEEPLAGHMSARQCGALARRAGVGKLVLSHLYPIPEGDAARVAVAAEEYSGPIVLAADQMVLTVSPLVGPGVENGAL